MAMLASTIVAASKDIVEIAYDFFMTRAALALKTVNKNRTV